MSDSLTALRRDLEMLGNLLLPPPPDASADDESPLASEPSAEDALRIRAYLILAHSGIEEAIETHVLTAVREATGMRGVPPPAVALSLVAKYSPDIVGQNAGKVPSPHEIIEKLPGLYDSKVIKPNNGIRRKSIETMCKPLGIDIDTLGDNIADMIGALDTLGAKRGAAAHSLRGAAQQVIHADEAQIWVRDALAALERILPLLVQTINRRALLT